MDIATLIFFLFAGTTLFSALMVVASRNPVHSVLFLILAFVNSGGLFLLAGAEFLAMMLVVVYVGAVAVLFLFVVMMLDIDFEKLRQGTMRYLPLGATVGLILMSELVMVMSAWVTAPAGSHLSLVPLPALDKVSNTRALGQLLYTHYIYIFQGAGMILLTAMIGAIVLTLRDRKEAKRQDIYKQHTTRKEDVLTVVNVKSGEGVSL